MSISIQNIVTYRRSPCISRVCHRHLHLAPLDKGAGERQHLLFAEVVQKVGRRAAELDDDEVAVARGAVFFAAVEELGVDGDGGACFGVEGDGFGVVGVLGL